MNVSRLVAKQTNTGMEEGLFAATPPLRRLLPATVIVDKPKLMFNDIRRAHMHARMASDIHVELCEENKTELGDEYRCRKLIKSMYGTMAAAHDWEAEADTGQGWRRVDVLRLSTTGFEQATIVKFYKCWACSWR